MREGWDISVVITTYNRAGVLGRALEGLSRQEAPGLRYEILVVDNNSSDATRAVVERAVSTGQREVRYIFEPRQGIAHGRNAGVREARSPIVAFTDDDVTVASDWVATMKRVFDAHPKADCIGGRVLPRDAGALPSWLGREHWGPLAILDYGDTPFYVHSQKRLCLITANAGFRRAMFDRIGLFATRMVVGSDNEILVRLWRAGGQGLYTPELRAVSDIEPERLTKRYHRRWHERHGHFSALMRDEALESSRYGRFLGVPAWIYRTAIQGAAGWAASSLRADPDRAFLHETRLRFALGFMRSRWRAARAGEESGAGAAV